MIKVALDNFISNCFSADFVFFAAISIFLIVALLPMSKARKAIAAFVVFLVATQSAIFSFIERLLFLKANILDILHPFVIQSLEFSILHGLLLLIVSGYIFILLCSGVHLEAFAGKGKGTTDLDTNPGEKGYVKNLDNLPE